METTTTIDEVKPKFDMPVHPACELFPMMDGDSLAALGDDIRTNGLVNPIVVHEGQIVDGRNRLLACQNAGVGPQFADWRRIYKGQMPIARWIWSINVERRHLTRDQIAATIVAIKAWEEQEAARQRQDQARKEQGGHGKEGGRGNRKALGPDWTPRVSGAAAKPESMGRVREKLAKEAGVSVRSVRQALTVQQADPELLKHVAHGDITLRQAEKCVTAEAASPTSVGTASAHRASTPIDARPSSDTSASPARIVRSQRIDRLARLTLSFVEATKHFAHVVGWLGETAGEFAEAELLLSNATKSIAAVSAEIERKAVAVDPLNASRLGIQEKQS